MEPNFTYYAAFKEASQPTTPSSGLVLFYAKNDKNLYYINSDGAEKSTGGISSEDSIINTLIFG